MALDPTHRQCAMGLKLRLLQHIRRHDCLSDLTGMQPFSPSPCGVRAVSPLAAGPARATKTVVLWRPLSCVMAGVKLKAVGHAENGSGWAAGPFAGPPRTGEDSLQAAWQGRFGRRGATADEHVLSDASRA